MSAAVDAGRLPGWDRTGFLRSLYFLLICVASVLLAYVLRPDEVISTFPANSLEKSIPTAFGDWKIDNSIVPVIPDPSTLAAINKIYSETVARTYVNRRGDRIMLSLAYGQRQNDTMRLHQPEGCYAGQGFAVRRIGQHELTVGDVTIPVMRLHASIGRREEPVTYWMIVGGEHAITQFQAKLAQLRFGLRGYQPDGLLFRVSSITADSEAGFRLQDDFVRDLMGAVSPEVRRGLLGS